MKAKLVCIDTNICIWGIKSQAKPGQTGEAEKIDRANKLFSDLDLDGVRICLPAIVLAEILVKEVESPDFEQFKNLIVLHRPILTFSTPCAIRHAKFIAGYIGKDNKRRAELMASPGYTKNMLRADLQIISTMLAYKINTLYTHEVQLTSIGKEAGLTVLTLPELSKPPTQPPPDPQQRIF